jgi:hypothetical protein
MTGLFSFNMLFIRRASISKEFDVVSLRFFSLFKQLR